jgi:hypothetical protein
MLIRKDSLLLLTRIVAGARKHCQLNLVDLLLSYSKRPELADDLATALRKLKTALSDKHEGSKSVRTEHERTRVWLRDRLTEGAIRQLVTRYQAGATGRELAAEFGISHSSVKRLLRERRVRRNA